MDEPEALRREPASVGGSGGVVCTPQGKVALVTGAAQGLGRAAALRLAADGMRVAVNDITDDGRLTELAEQVGGVPVPADIADAGAVPAMVAAVARALGPVQ